MPNNVRCTVSNCTYWDEGNRCGADVILITNDRIAGIQDDKMEIGEIGETPADASEETCCKTFKPEGT